MSRKRRGVLPGFKARVALAAAKGDKTLGELSRQYGVHPTQISAWKARLQEGVAELFEDRRKKRRETEASVAELYQQIGRLTMEVDWFKKSSRLTTSTKREWIEPDHGELSVRRQCAWLGLARTSWYYEPVAESAENLALMRKIDRQYLATPFYGSRRMAVELGVNRKRVQRLMRIMGREVVYPKPRLSQRAAEHRIYPYLLRKVEIVRPNQVWSSDITYLPLSGGYLDLTVVRDWSSRHVLSWRLSNTLDGRFVLAALDEALAQSRPEIFNTDQGSQYTSVAFTGRLESAGVQISMDGRSRALDNVFVERLWRTVKYEEVYLKDYADGREAEQSLKKYFRFYTPRRRHQSLGYRTPAAVYHDP